MAAVKYLVYCEFNGGDEDRTIFSTLAEARKFAEQEIGPDSDSDVVYIERVDGVDRELIDDGGYTNKYDIEIGCDTIGHYTRSVPKRGETLPCGDSESATEVVIEPTDEQLGVAAFCCNTIRDRILEAAVVIEPTVVDAINIVRGKLDLVVVTTEGDRAALEASGWRTYGVVLLNPNSLAARTVAASVPMCPTCLCATRLLERGK